MKVFTVEEANALLPTVGKMVARIAKAHERVIESSDAAKEAADGVTLSGGGGMKGGPEYVAALLELYELVAEVGQLGVQIKDYGRGLIDFPSMREGRMVFLCWQLGEGDSLAWWHDLEAGFAGRQRL